MGAMLLSWRTAIAPMGRSYEGGWTRSRGEQIAARQCAFQRQQGLLRRQPTAKADKAAGAAHMVAQQHNR